jgi:hypothetical protein
MYRCMYCVHVIYIMYGYDLYHWYVVSASHYCERPEFTIQVHCRVVKLTPDQSLCVKHSVRRIRRHLHPGRVNPGQYDNMMVRVVWYEASIVANGMYSKCRPMPRCIIRVEVTAPRQHATSRALSINTIPETLMRLLLYDLLNLAISMCMCEHIIQYIPG